MSLTEKDQLLITLLRLRRGFNLYILAHFYSVTESYIRKSVTAWIMFLYHHFKDLKEVMFPDRDAFQHLKPKIFKYFKNIPYSVDCAEFFCEVPRNYAQQGNIYSAYKHHTTMKCLIAVNPNGAACFISNFILNYINTVNSLLVDKGFAAQDFLTPGQATVFIPPFLEKPATFAKEEILLTKRIAKARIHVERFNEWLKKFRLLDKTVPLTLVPIASQLVYVAACLANVQDCLYT